MAGCVFKALDPILGAGRSSDAFGLQHIHPQGFLSMRIGKEGGKVADTIKRRSDDDVVRGFAGNMGGGA